MWKIMGHGFTWICMDLGLEPGNQKICVDFQKGFAYFVGPGWAHMGHMGPYGPIWTQMGPNGPLRAHIGPGLGPRGPMLEWFRGLRPLLSCL